MKRSGRSARYVFGVWTGIAVASGVAGAILAMVADTMIPEAFEKTHRCAGLIATIGFLTAFAIGRI